MFWELGIVSSGKTALAYFSIMEIIPQSLYFTQFLNRERVLRLTVYLQVYFIVSMVLQYFTGHNLSTITVNICSSKMILLHGQEN